MFHRITLEAGKLQSARLVKLSKSTQSSSNKEQRQDDSRSYYEDISQEAETFFRGNKLPISFLIYLLLGSVFYHFDYRNKTTDFTESGAGKTNFVFGFYEVSFVHCLIVIIGVASTVCVLCWGCCEC